MDLAVALEQCAHGVHQDTMRRILKVESSFNPWAIGVVGGRLQRQPRDRAEAVATASWLERNGYNYSVGYAQVNRINFARFGMTPENAFNVCVNLHAGSQILAECYERARGKGRKEQDALRDAFSCYYSGNFTTGYRTGYVALVTGETKPRRASSADDSRPLHKQGEVADDAGGNSLNNPAYVEINNDEMTAAPTAERSAFLF